MIVLFETTALVLKFILRRDALYQKAKESHPRRWSGLTRNWSPITEVQLNPDRKLKGAA